MMSADITTIVIFGGNGDLAQRKLVPALFHLTCKSRLPQKVKIVGVARTPYSDDEYRALMWKGARELADLAPRQDEWEAFAANLHYQRGDLTRLEDFEKLKMRLDELEGDGLANRLFFMSVAPQFYEPGVRHLGESGLARFVLDGRSRDEEGGWRRVVIEKPFGWDLRSAQELNRAVSQVFSEEQVFRIDHYLGKETVQNLIVFRFANAIFEPLWNRNYIDNVQITVSEDVTVGERAGYYDKSGVVRDMVQNHLLQLLTIVAMEPPSVADAESLRDKKVEVLRAIRRWTPEEAVRNAALGQYMGYTDEEGIPKDSRTATYAALRLFVDNWRWGGVPFYLRTGKALSDKVSEIVIQFQRPPHLMFTLGAGRSVNPNVLSFCIQPDEGVHLTFEAKVPGRERAVESRNMEFHYESAFEGQSIPEAYERLLEDAIAGDASLFIRKDQIEEAWKIVDPLIQAWEERNLSPLHVYEPGSKGPDAADKLLAERGHRWLQVCGWHS
ncbi:MAG: glucose-6-phosphate dehydrogenase [Chloroflexi bacterium]|nr:glucose-6-phosphate dehydrogenase [Chloroflexota bacterium]